MEFKFVNGVNALNIDMIATVALAGILLMIGFKIIDKFPIFSRLCIPAPVIGGFICAIIVWILRGTNVLQVNMDTTLQLPFMLAFFTCVGFSGSFKLLKSGGRPFLIFLVSCWILALIQCVVGVGLASALKINPVLGIMAGTVSLVGGHGNAAAFGPVAENLGVHGATTVAIASATFGLVVGSVIGGPLGNYLIKKNDLKIETEEDTNETLTEQHTDTSDFAEKTFLSHLTLIFLFMFGGIVISDLVLKMNIKNFALPNYVGAMFLAIIFRNINEKKEIVKLDYKVIDLILNIGLSFFLTMAIMTLHIWELVDLALPLIIILLVQTIILLVFSMFVVFPMLGKNYDGAVMTGGYAGWGLGIAATAVVCMSAICDKYKVTSTKAFLIVPLCGAVFVDVVAIPTIIFFITKFA
ncbi:sodium/glutamate symporter [Companilactobacillus jidongensis]|uniref:sodium/glutamate symporter n=1 Tax=Companilactobacillus jidongensis TaxID=2486006 RepID=UPI000F7955BA|nr:sodium/glutamate symporter [Companilactobacillus jidongensis]